MIDIGFFGKNFYYRYRDKIRSLTYDDCFLGNNFRTIDEFSSIALEFTPALWMRLRSALLLARLTLNQIESDNATNDIIVATPHTLSNFLSRTVKGSKKFRQVIDKSVSLHWNVLDLQCLKTFCTIVGVNIPPIKIAESYFKSWNASFVSNDIREFIFKCRNNVIQTGGKLSHITKNADQLCFMCSCLSSSNITRESFAHLFRKCPVTSNLLMRLNKTLGIVWQGENWNFEDIYWFGNISGVFNGNVLLIYDIFRYLVWTAKMQRVFPNEHCLISNFSGILQTIFRIKPCIKLSFSRNASLANILRVTG